ncbi:hypothetical protein V6N13_104762 [Hibiscus sabdariffa]
MGRRRAQAGAVGEVVDMAAEVGAEGEGQAIALTGQAASRRNKHLGRGTKVPWVLYGSQPGGRNQGLAERVGRMHSIELGLKHSMETLGHTEVKRSQGSVQRTPNRCKQGCQCTGRARQQERGASPVYLTPTPTRGRATWRITSKDGRGLAPQRAKNNAPAVQKQAGH